MTSTYAEHGFPVLTLTNASKLYNAYAPSISQAMLAKLTDASFDEIRQAMLDEFGKSSINRKSQALISKLYPFKLSWSHYLLMLLKHGSGSDNES